MDENKPLDQNAQTAQASIDTKATQTSSTIKPKRTLKWLLIILGILELPLPLSALTIGPPILKIQNSLMINPATSLFGICFFGFVVCIAVCQIALGAFSLESRVGRNKVKWILISGLVLSILTIPAMIYSLIYPIYNITSQI